MKEGEIQNSILEYLQWKGIYCWRNNSVGIYDPVKKKYRKPKGRFHINGVSDILGILPNGQFLAIEVKSKTGKVTEEQEMFMAHINRCGGVAFVARSIEDVKNSLQSLT